MDSYLGGKIRRFKGLGHHLHDIYYKYSLQKFNAFLLTDYDRVVVMDADGLAASNLDHLFFLPLNNRVPIAAPQGYWFQDQGFSIAKHGENCFGNLLFLASMLNCLELLLLQVLRMSCIHMWW